jgi:ribonuclease R
VVLLKKLRLLDTIHRKEPNKQFEAIVTRVKNFGIHFEILELMLESFLHVSQLENDYYVYSEASASLQGRHTGKQFHAGDKVLVMLTDVNFITLESNWSFVASMRDESIQQRLHEPKASKKKEFVRPRKKANSQKKKR